MEINRGITYWGGGEPDIDQGQRLTQYAVGDKVGHSDGKVYLITGVNPDGSYKLGYTQDGATVEITAGVGEFDRISDIAADVGMGIVYGKIDRGEAEGIPFET